MYWKTELTAHEHYNGFCLKAIEEDYPNIAYLFRAFSVSEKVHAENYKRILSDFGAEIGYPKINTVILNTKKNVHTASKNELGKIKDIYPGFIKRLMAESHDQAVISCMYSWRSHQQHKAEINDIHKYSKFFFRHVAKEIEGMKLNFNVCDICGSTLMEAPQGPCEICNYPMNHYQSIKRPSV